MNKDSELGIVALLDRNASCRQDWMQSPQVAHIPFMRTRDSFFLLVNLHMKSEANSRDRLVTGCLTVAQVVIGSGFLTDERAVEISAFVDVPERKNLKRVFRLSVSDTAFAQALQIHAAGLLNNPPPGITCQWPVRFIR
jgi:hypothetical protein